MIVAISKRKEMCIAEIRNRGRYGMKVDAYYGE